MNLYSRPFKHAVIDDFLAPDVVREINAQWPTDWRRKSGKTSVKMDSQALPAAAARVVRDFDIGLVEQVTGIEGLFADPELFGAGLHCIPRGGHLQMHVDFNVHPKGWHRRANVLIYLNEVWQNDWEGHLLLGKHREKAIAPIGGRCVIFETNEHSWHGHPAPLSCPPDVQRRSLALYFYTRTQPDAKAHTTIYETER